MYGTPLRSCGGCGGSFLGDNRNEIYFCPKCTRGLPEFDPQPYEKCNGRPDKQRCRYQGRDMVVLEREGDMVTVRPLGRPDASSATVHIGQLRPVYASPGR
jgi:hypothetical protein